MATDRSRREPLRRTATCGLCEQAAARVRRRTGRTISAWPMDYSGVVSAAAIDRAGINVIDNAASLSNDGTIEVVGTSGRVAVRDRGPASGR